MPQKSEFTFLNDPAATAAINKRLARHNRLQVAVIKRAKDPRPLAERLADAMLELAGSGQTVDRNALGLKGFTSLEMSDRMLAKARDIANARAIRQV